MFLLQHLQVGLFYGTWLIINRDLDLLRDPRLTGKGQKLKDSSFDRDVKHHPNWQCAHCGNSYDVIEVEQRLDHTTSFLILCLRLLDDLERIIASYLIQVSS